MFLFNILLVAIGFGFLVFIHEFGHFILAKRNGVKVITFSLGFGPKLVKFNYGETEYALSAIPLGGYCKLAGEIAGEKNDDAPPEKMLNNKTIWQRAKIFAAGATFNLLIAFPLAILLVLVGRVVPITEVAVVPGSTAFVEGLEDGDVITAVNDTEVRFWKDCQAAIASQEPNVPFTISVLRGDKKMHFEMQKDEKDSPIGVYVRPTRRIAAVHPRLPAQRAGFRAYDEILRVAKGDTTHDIEKWDEFEKIVQDSPGEELIVSVRREKQNQKGEYDILPLTVKPTEEKEYHIGATFDFPPVVGSVRKGNPADIAGLKKGDRIVQINGQPITLWSEVTSTIRTSRAAFIMQIEREGEQIELAIERPTPESFIGITAEPKLLIAELDDDSPAAQAGLLPGDQIKRVNDVPAKHLQGLMLDSPEPANLTIVRNGEEMEIEVATVERKVGTIGVFAQQASAFYRPSNPVEAVTEGVQLAGRSLVGTIRMLRMLFAGEVSTSELSGPVGIFTLTYREADTNWTHYINILMALSISLGIFNLLPIPVLDGGHLAFLVIEKIKGRPVSDKVMLTAQYVGLIMLLGLILFVTWGDVASMIGA